MVWCAYATHPWEMPDGLVCLGKPPWEMPHGLVCLGNTAVGDAAWSGVPKHHSRGRCPWFGMPKQTQLWECPWSGDVG